MKIIKNKTLFIILLSAALLSSCFNPLSGPLHTENEKEGTPVSIRLTLSESVASSPLSLSRGFSPTSVSITATRTDDSSTTETLDISIETDAITAEGSFAALTAGEWLFEALAEDSAGNSVLAGTALYTVVDGEDNFVSIYLFANVGNVVLTADWTGPGAVDTLRVTASRATFDEVVSEAYPTKDSETGTVQVFNLAAGSGWSLHLEGLNQGEVCFEDTVIAGDVIAAGSISASSNLSQINVTPVRFSREAGSFVSDFTLELSTDTPGATIYYTTNGEDPTASSGTEYTGSPIPISGDTIKAMAVKAGVDGDSAVTEAVYEVDAILSISTSYNHNAMIKEDDTLWTWGDGTYGKLGTGDTTDESRPVQIGEAEWQKVSAGYNHTAAIKIDGSLWAWGYNNYGQLGDGTTAQKELPVPLYTADGVITWETWTDVAAGDDFTLAINTSGELYAFGYGYFGQLGQGNDSNSSFPLQVGTDTDWTSLSAGKGFVLALKNDGTLWSWGYNNDDALGLGSAADSYVYTPTQVGTDTDWQEVSAGGEFSLGLKTDGTVWIWGGYEYYTTVVNPFNDSGDQETPQQMTTATNWAAIEAGYQHAAIINVLGEVWLWGKNDRGHLGTGGTANTLTPTLNSSVPDTASAALGYEHSLAITEDGKVYAWGGNDDGELADINGFYFHRLYPTRVGTATDWTSISAGTEFNTALNSSGQIWLWGKNERGQMGDGTTTSRVTLAPLTNPTGVSAWSKVSAGVSFIAAITDTGDLYSWGENNYGQLGYGDVDTYGLGTPTEVQAFFQGNWADVSCGQYFTIGLKTTGELYTWGYNYYGQLGLGDTDTRHFPVRESTAATHWTDIATGDAHVIALTTEGTIWSWGLNTTGQLGLGHENNVSTPTQMGTDTDWIEIAAGGTSSLARKSDGSLWTWGGNTYGELGHGSTNEYTAPVKIRGESGWSAISAGSNHVLALKTDDTLWAWGYESLGRLGNGVNSTSKELSPIKVDNEPDWTMVEAGGTHSLGIKNDGSLWVWGSNHYNACGVHGYYDYDPYFPVPFLTME